MLHGRVLSAALIALFFTTSAYSLSTPPPWAAVGGSVVDQQNGYISTLQHDESVGALPGTASVSGGAATYTIPIELPPGRANMERKVA